MTTVATGTTFFFRVQGLGRGVRMGAGRDAAEFKRPLMDRVGGNFAGPQGDSQLPYTQSVV